MKTLAFLKYLKSFFLKWISPFVLLWIIWKAVSFALMRLKGVSFPTPEDVVLQFLSCMGGEQILGHSLWLHTFATIKRWLLGYATGIAAGMGIGLVCAMSEWLTMAFYPLVFMFQMVPGLAWIPIAILIAGIGNETAIFMIAISSFAPIAIGLMDGMKAVPAEYLCVSRMCGDTRLRRFFLVQLPAALPLFITGLRLALANSWRVVVAAEMVVGSGAGLGYAIFQSRWDMNYEAAFVCIGVIVFLGLLVERWGFRQLEQYTLRRWGMLGEFGE